MALAIYRKYRPTTFEDLLGQELIIKIIKEAAKQDKLSHAYLFTGPRGTGKTTTARLIAKIANCQKRINDENFKKLGEPCNTCNSCQTIDENRNLDVIEIDAASNRGIDEIRNLKEIIKTAPNIGPYKIFIIDEAHMLTKEAFNALLKTLEEPPEYTIFILITTEFDKIPATIKSRTQQFLFKKIPLNLIVQKLQKICDQEKINIDQNALELIASTADGSFRDAESLLDEMFSAGTKKITLNDVEKSIGIVGFNNIYTITNFLLTNDLNNSLNKIYEIYNNGYNILQLTKDLIQHLRRIIVLKYNPNLAQEFKKELTEEDINKILAQSKLFSDKHLNLLKNLLSALVQMRYSQFPIIPLEIALIESFKIEKNK
ncbi:MAG: DNA polymerase III subunit gamma/tau [Minisyncoccia bacterium]